MCMRQNLSCIFVVIVVLTLSDSLIPSSKGVKRQAGQGGNSACSFKRFLYVSKTLSRNPEDSAVSMEQFNF